MFEKNTVTPPVLLNGRIFDQDLRESLYEIKNLHYLVLVEIM